MPSDASGNYALPAGYLATTGTTVLASQHNTPLEDLATGHSARLMRSGAAPMTGPLRLVDGTSTAPAMTFATDPTKGFYKTPSGFAAKGFISSVPIGAVVDFAGQTAPDGWLMCFGQSLVRTDYPDLFSVLTTLYGAADSSHFSLPDCRGVTTAGRGDMGGVDRGILTGSANVLGTLIGTQTVTLLTANLPAYTPAGTVTKPGVTISGQGSSGPVILQTGGIILNLGSGNFTNNVLSAALDATPVFTGTAQGGTSTPVANVQPTTVFNKIIFAGV